MRMLIGGIMPVSTEDYLGQSAAVIYFGGCNFRCRHCMHHRILKRKHCSTILPSDVFKEVMAEEFIDAVVFSGGEPTIQEEPLFRLAEHFKNQGLKIKVDTNGSNSGVLSEMLMRKFIDKITLSIKAPLESERAYDKVIGMNAADDIHEIKKLLQMKHAFKFELECKTDIIPGLVSHHRQIQQIAREVSKAADIYTLQQFDRSQGCLDPYYNSAKPMLRDEMISLAGYAKRYIKDVRIRTTDQGEEGV